MLKKNILGVVVIVLIMGAFAAGYVVGKGSVPVPDTQSGRPGQKMAGAPAGEQPAGRPSSENAKSGSQPQTGEQTPKAGTPESQSSSEAQPDVAQKETPAPVGQVFYGTAVPYDEANIQSKQGGTITMIEAKEGDSIKKDTVLVRFDDSDMKLELESAKSSKNSALQQVQQAESNFKTVQTNVKRTQKLFDDGLVSKQELDSITNQLETARASLNSSKESVTQANTQISMTRNSLKDFQVTAALSGIVDKKNYNLGEVYQGGSVIYHVINIDQVYIEVEIPETYIQKIRQKMKANVIFDALSEQKFSGVVDTILPSGASDNRNFTAKVLVNNAKHAIRPGMFARVEMALDD